MKETLEHVDRGPEMPMFQWCKAVHLDLVQKTSWHFLLLFPLQQKDMFTPANSITLSLSKNVNSNLWNRFHKALLVLRAFKIPPHPKIE